MPPEKKTAVRTRVNLRLPDDLVKWAKRHGKEKKQTFTDVVETALVRERKRHGT